MRVLRWFGPVTAAEITLTLPPGSLTLGAGTITGAGGTVALALLPGSLTLGAGTIDVAVTATIIVTQYAHWYEHATAEYHEQTDAHWAEHATATHRE